MKMPLHLLIRTPTFRRTQDSAFLLFGDTHNGEYRSVTLNQAIETVVQYWPHLFPHGILRPMASDILEQLMADKLARQLPLTDTLLKQCVSVILATVAYQATLMPGALRYDSKGYTAGLVKEWE